MADWITPIFDRTQSDVDYARQLLLQRKNDVELKGCFNVSDITRIDNNARHLSDKLFELYYSQDIVTQASWGMGNVPTQSSVDRIINNIEKLWKGYHKPTGAVDLPLTLLDYKQVNAIEKNLYLIKEMLDDMTSSFRECGTFNCGED